MPVILHFPNNINTSGLDTSDATAKPDNILQGYTAYAKGQKIEGIISSKAAHIYIPSTENQKIEAGQYIAET